MAKGLFLKVRLKAIWGLLTRRLFVVILTDPYAKHITCYHAVDAESVQRLSAAVVVAIETVEGQGSALQQAKEILNHAE